MNIEDSIRTLSGAHPALANTRAAIEREWAPDSPPPTVLSSALAKTLVGIADRTSDEGLVRVLSDVETILCDGDDLSKDVVATGFLEALVAEADRQISGASRLIGLLGPGATAYCNAWSSSTR